MGLFDFFKAFNTSKKVTLTPTNLPSGIIGRLSMCNSYLNKYKNDTDTNIYLLYCDFGSAHRNILDSTKPETYFSNYVKALQILEALCVYKSYRFKKPSPFEQRNELIKNYSVYTNNFIKRYWNSNFEAAQKLKTEKGRTNRIAKFFDTIENQYPDCLTNENTELILSLKKNDTLLISQQIDVKCKDYDVSTVEGIRAIPKSDTEAMRLLQKCATNHKRNNNYLLAYECLLKSNEISDCHSQPDKLSAQEYSRVISYSKLISKELMEQTEDQVKNIHPEFYDKRISNRYGIKESLCKQKEWNNDLVEVFTNTTCPICSKYHKKIYSISGKSRKYPKLPIEIINQTQECQKCYHSISGYFEGISTKP